MKTIPCVLIRFVLGASLCASALTAFAQKQKIPIGVDCQSHDAVGNAFCYEVKTQLARSAIFSYWSTEKEPYFEVDMVTINVSKGIVDDQNNYATAVSFTLLLVADNSSILLDQRVFIAGSNQIEYTAKQLMADLDQYFSGNH